MTYEGWKEVGKNRYALVGKEYVAGYMSGEERTEDLGKRLTVEQVAGLMCYSAHQ